MFNRINFKMRKVIVLFSILLIATLAIAMIETVSASNTEINSATSGGIKLAIKNAQNGDTIYLNNGVYNGENNTNIAINKNIRIEGVNSKVVLDGQGTNMFFKIQQNSVTIKNLKFINGYNGNGNGGAINSKGNLTLINCTFTKDNTYNKTNNKGGAIYSAGNLTVSQSIFTKHLAKFGGAIYSTGNLVVISSIFTGNKASGKGGAIYSAVTEVKKSIFTNNNAGYGGSIVSYKNTHISSCIFKNNKVKHNGGAISSQNNLTVSKCTFTTNKAGYEGGAIVALDSSKIINSKFNKNQAYLRGGAISSSFFGPLYIKGSTFTNNKAYVKKKVPIYSVNGKPLMTVKAQGGAVYHVKSAKIINSKFKNNIAGKVYNAIDKDPQAKKAFLKNVKISPKLVKKFKKC